MIRFLIKFWPVLIPLLIFFGWLAYYRLVKKEKYHPKTVRYFITSVVSTLVLLLGAFVLYFMEVEHDDRIYIPSRMENGVLIPGQKVAPPDEKQ